MTQPRVFIPQPIPPRTIEYLRSVAQVEVYPYSDRMISIAELAAAATRNDYLFTLHETPITREVVAANPHLKGIVYWDWDLSGDQKELVDVDACQEAGVPLLSFHGGDLERTRSLNAKATADLTLALLMCLAYRVVEADEYTRAGRFRQEMTMELMGVGCTHKAVGVIGMGVVAQELVPRLRALDMEVRYTKRTRLEHATENALGVIWVDSIDRMLPDVDFVCMLANYNSSSYLLMTEERFALMRPSAYFINTGRGRLVDEDALIRALQNGTIAGAGLDVFFNEPPVVADPYVPEALRRLPNVVLAPHNGGATWQARETETMTVANAIVAAINAQAAG